MEAKDLMIGDKLKTIFSQKVVKVKEIKQNCIYTEDNGYEYDEIEPILLTSNILEKNGWIYNNMMMKTLIALRLLYSTSMNYNTH